MSSRSKALPAAVATIVATLMVIGGARALPPGSSYPWAEPGCAPVTSEYTQPPAWISVAPTVAVPPGSDYAWAQPGCAIVTTPFAQPPA